MMCILAVLLVYYFELYIVGMNLGCYTIGVFCIKFECYLRLCSGIDVVNSMLHNILSLWSGYYEKLLIEQCFCAV